MFSFKDDIDQYRVSRSVPVKSSLSYLVDSEEHSKWLLEVKKLQVVIFLPAPHVKYPSTNDLIDV